MQEYPKKNWLGQTEEPNSKPKVELKTEPTPLTTQIKNDTQIPHNHQGNSHISDGMPNMSAEEYAQFQQITNGWSWGGSFLTLFTLIVGKNWWLLSLLIISWLIPIINIIAWLIWFIYGGLNGKKIIYKSPSLSTIEEKKGAIKAMEMAGFGAFIIFIGSFLSFLIFSTMIYSIIAAVFRSAL